MTKPASDTEYVLLLSYDIIGRNLLHSRLRAAGLSSDFDAVKANMHGAGVALTQDGQLTVFSDICKMATFNAVADTSDPRIAKIAGVVDISQPWIVITTRGVVQKNLQSYGDEAETLRRAAHAEAIAQFQKSLLLMKFTFQDSSDKDKLTL